MTFYCSVPDQSSLIEVRQRFGSFDYQNAALRNKRVFVALPAEEQRQYERLDAIAASCLRDGMSEKEKAQALHDYMVRQYDYDPGTAAGGDALYGCESWSYRGLLENGYGVCQAYMELYYLLCTHAGLDCGIVTGSADGGSGWGSHGWNVLYFSGDDTPYYVDVTFDDPVGGDGTIFYDYFLVTADRLTADHVW
jgi:transglutaminase/protease-like cytokinesis protein 3